MHPATKHARTARRSRTNAVSSGPAAAPFTRSTWLWAGGAVLLAMLVYLLTLGFGFVYDDIPQILQNPTVQAHSFQTEFFTGHVWQHVFPHWTGNYYRPLFLLWMQSNYLLFGARPGWWHLECLVIHGLVTLLVFLLGRRLLAADRPAFLAAALFAVLPAHAEVVAWISGADESMACLLLLASLLCWLRAREQAQHSLSWQTAALTVFAAAVFMKENAIVLPGILFLYEWSLGDGARAGLRRCLPFCGIAAGYLAARLFALHGMASFVDAIAPRDVLLTFPQVFWFYFVRMVWPFGTSLFYDLHAQSSVTFYGFFIPLLQCVAICGIAIVVSRASRLAAFLLGGTLLLLLPMFAGMFIFPKDELVHDRYVYVPSVLLLIVLAAGLARLATRWPKWLPAGVGAVVLALFSLSTISAAYPWRDTVQLFRHATQMAPHNPRPRLFLADELAKRRASAEAVELYKQVLAMEPGSVYALLGMGAAEFDLGHFAESERVLQQAEAAPATRNTSTVYYMLGMTENRMQKYADAERHLRRAIALHPYFSRYHYELAVALKGQGKLDEARGALRTELEIFPESPGARELLQQMGG